MKSKLIILFSFLVLLVAAAFTLKKKNNFQTEEIEQTNRLVFPNLPVQEIHTLIVSNKYGNLTLKKNDTGWVIVERENYPASPIWINEVLNTIANLSLIQETHINPSHLKQLGLIDPTTNTGDGVGQRIDLYGENNYQSHLIIGTLQSAESEKSMMFGDDFDGRCFVKTNENDVYIIDQSMSFINTIPVYWMMNVMSIPRQHKSISYTKNGEQLWKALKNGNEENFKIYNKNSTLGTPLNGLSHLLDYTFSSLSFRDVKPKDFDRSSVKITGDHYFELETHDGFIQRIHLGGQTPPSKQELELATQETGVFRSRQNTAYRYIYLEWLNQRKSPPPEEAPYSNLTYLAASPRLSEFMINYEEMLVFQQLTPDSNETN